MSDVSLKPYTNIAYHNSELKSLTRYRFDKVKERAALKSSVMPDVRQVLPNMITHPEFGRALAEATAAGVKVLYMICNVKPDSLSVTECIEA